MKPMSTITKKKKKPFYICHKCDYQSVKWLGRCPECGEWESLIEEKIPLSSGASRSFTEPVPLHLAPDGDEERISSD